jgi:hypothetical protein
MFYVRFYDMVVLDVDGAEPNAELRSEAATVFPQEMTWAVTRTAHGFHMYLVSHRLPYFSNAAVATFFRWEKCDPWYKTLCVMTGSKVRVSPKFAGERLLYPTELWSGGGSGKEHTLRVQMQKVILLNLLRRHHEQHPSEPYEFVTGLHPPPAASFFHSSFFYPVLVHNPRLEPKVVTALQKIVDHHRSLPAGTRHRSAHRVLIESEDLELQQAARNHVRLFGWYSSWLSNKILSF